MEREAVREIVLSNCSEYERMGYEPITINKLQEIHAKCISDGINITMEDLMPFLSRDPEDTM